MDEIAPGQKNICGEKKQAILEAAKFLAENRIHSIQIDTCVVCYESYCNAFSILLTVFIIMFIHST